jgi:hypothetical protein
MATTKTDICTDLRQSGLRSVQRVKAPRMGLGWNRSHCDGIGCNIPTNANSLLPRLTGAAP